MDRTTKEKMRLGIFVLVGTVFLVIAAYLIGNNQDMFSRTFTISTVFNNVNGLRLGNNVRFSGINVGIVKSIEMENDSIIRVKMAIEEKMRKHITTDAVASIGSDGLVGNMIVNIIPGRMSGERVQEGNQIASYSRIGAEDMLGTLNVTNQNAALLTADLLQVTQALTQGKGTLGRLLNDTLMAGDLQKMILNLKQASGRANKTIADLNAFLEKVKFEESVAGVLLSDTIAAERVRSVIAHLESSSIHIDSLTRNLNTTIGEIRHGKGAVTYLLKDTTLVRRLDSTMLHIQEGTARFNENMEALKHSFLTRRYFRKLEKQARVEEEN
ncbi:MlaD family protein [Flavobacteriaceae bacterium 3-367]|uniref:MlaD family protein n=1 Tax=Eudoraea algarum TaxID=3417568 RepID=UPI00328A8B5F